MNRRAAMRVRDHDGLLRLRTIAITAKTTAEMTHVHVLLGDACDLRSAETRFLRALIAEPDVDPIIPDEHCRIAWLHTCARQIRRGIRCFDDLRGASKRGIHIALIDAYFAGTIERGNQCVAHVRSVERCTLRRDFPLDRHALE